MHQPAASATQSGDRIFELVINAKCDEGLWYHPPVQLLPKQAAEVCKHVTCCVEDLLLLHQQGLRLPAAHMLAPCMFACLTVLAFGSCPAAAGVNSANTVLVPLAPPA